MIATIVVGPLPTSVTLLFGLFAGWHHDFGAKQANNASFPSDRLGQK
jgi:hypothetical protein